MDEQYYRKEPHKRRVVSWLKKGWNNQKVRLSLLIIVPIISLMTFGNRGIIQRIRLESQKRDMQTKIREAEKERASREQQVKALGTDKRIIEKVAREKYGMMREGETVYKIRKEK